MANVRSDARSEPGLDPEPSACTSLIFNNVKGRLFRLAKINYKQAGFNVEHGQTQKKFKYLAAAQGSCFGTSGGWGNDEVATIATYYSRNLPRESLSVTQI
jgi:hypothetical protein